MAKDLVTFNWEFIYKSCQGNMPCILKYFKSRHKLPQGKSFILDLSSLLQDKNSSVSDKTLYLYLASLRNYFDYQYLHQTGLYIHFADVNKDIIKNNKLLKIDNDLIQFYYEE